MQENIENIVLIQSKQDVLNFNIFEVKSNANLMCK